MKKLTTFFFLLIVLSVISAGGAITQSASPSSSPVASVLPSPTVIPTGSPAITFPIPELGNCASKEACRNYCEIPANKSACLQFGKTHNINGKPDPKIAQILAFAKIELGCDSKDTCRLFCDQSPNGTKCDDFFRRHKLNTKDDHPEGKPAALALAKKILGCDSVVSCKALCALSENHDKCSDFAHKNGLSGGVKRVGPGGCTSVEDCRLFCRDSQNNTLCSAYPAFFHSPKPSSSPKAFKGPGGCTSPEACRQYCSEPKHIAECSEISNTRSSSSPRPSSSPETEIEDHNETPKPSSTISPTASPKAFPTINN